MNSYFIPLTHKLGLYAAKGELEDLYLKYTQPESFYAIKSMLGETKRAREEYLQSLLPSLGSALIVVPSDGATR